MKNLINLLNTHGYGYLQDNNLDGYNRYFDALLRACTSDKQKNGLYAIRNQHFRTLNKEVA